MSDGADNPSSKQTKIRDVLPLSLRKVGQSQALDHAVIMFPASYEDALTAAIKVFKLPSSLSAEIRYPIRKAGTSKCHWGRILPEKWLKLVGEGTEDLALIMPSDPNSPRALPSEGDENTVLETMHLISVHESSSSKKIQDQRFVVPLPATYEDCVKQAFKCFMPHWLHIAPLDSSIALMGIYPAAQPGASPKLARLSPVVYGTYIKTKRASGDPIDLAVSW